MADTCLGPPLSLPSSSSHSSINSAIQIPFQIPFAFFLSHRHSLPFSSHSRNLSFMATFRNNTRHCQCSSASTTTNGMSTQPSLLVFSGMFILFFSPSFSRHRYTAGVLVKMHAFSCFFEESFFGWFFKKRKNKAKLGFKIHGFQERQNKG